MLLSPHLTVKSRLQEEEKKFYEEVIDKLQFTADAVAKNTHGCDTMNA